LRAVIVEDEPDNLRLLLALLVKHCKNIDVVGTAITAEEGANAILSLKPDLVFLDIGLPDQSGFEMLESLGDYSFDVIFTTIHDHYAIQAIRCSALDYLLKPVDATELRKAVVKAERAQKGSHTREQLDNVLRFIRHSGLTGHKIGLPLTGGIRFVNPDEIIHCQSSNNYTYFFLTTKEKLIVSKGMYEFEEILAPYRIIRCHQSHLVNIKYIKSLDRRKDYVNELELLDGTMVPVSRLRLEEVKGALANR
jgi:two-component system LytT family response regulator